MNDRLRTALGFLILLVAATAPLQITFGQQVDAEPPRLLAWFAAASPVAATLAALAAAYWTAQQARETGRQATEMIQSRRAEHLLPKFAELLEVLDDARHVNQSSMMAERYGEYLDHDLHWSDLVPEWVRHTSSGPTLRRLDLLIDVLKLFSEEDLIMLLEDIRNWLPPAQRYRESGRTDVEALEQERAEVDRKIELARSMVVERGEQLSRPT